MIPVRLNLRNFMCYSDAHQALEFDGIHVACLSGPNGHGKSALLDAITWALWGKSRARSSDDLIRVGNGVQEMEVEFEFRLGAQQYRVLRKRSKRTRAGHTLLDLAVLDGDGYRQLNGNNVNETERQIQQLLRMSYETFTNSAFVLQGKADAFTTRTPGERKQVLAEILDLSYFDRLEDLARQRVRERDQLAGLLRQQIAEDDEELRQRPELEHRQQRLEGERDSLEQRLQLVEAEAELARERLGRLQADRRALDELDRRLAEARERAERQRGLLARAKAALAQAGKVVDRETEIEQGYQRLVSQREALQKLTVVQAEHVRLTRDLAQLEARVGRARGDLEGRRALLEKQLACIEDLNNDVERFTSELATVRTELESLEQVEQKRAELERARLDARERWASLKAQIAELRKRQGELGDRRQLLGTSPTCPVCRTELGVARQQSVVDHYLEEERRSAERAAELDRQQIALEQEGKGLAAQLKDLETRLDGRRQLQERVASAERVLAQAQQRLVALQELQAELGRVRQDLERGAYAAGEREELKLLERQLAGLRYDAEAHRAVLAEVETLGQYEELRRELLEARRTLAREEQARAEASQALAEWEAVARSAEQQRGELERRTAELPAVEEQFGRLEAELRVLRPELGRLNQDLGAVRQHLATMDFTARRRTERLAELDRARTEQSLHQELAQAFGKKGVQALLIETAIPEIEAEANRLLELLTDGRMHVRFETQRSAKVGDGTIETLDIIIEDELGARQYELFSGGEKFRVDFALRIALSKLLAQRAGARLQTLVIDEGFGTQDDQGLDRLVEAIKTIQHEFEKIIVITHLSDLKEAFPVRIEVQKTPAGSVFEVA